MHKSAGCNEIEVQIILDTPKEEQHAVREKQTCKRYEENEPS